MDVHLLGQIEAVDGGPLALGGPTQRRVLAALALHRNEVVSIPHLVEVIWADGEPPDRAEHNVRTYVHRLRSSLDGHGERIDTIGAGYRIRLDADELDVARFEQLAGTAKRLADTGEVVAALDLIDKAERLWRGAPVQEFEHEAWAMPDAVRLRELYSLLRARRAELLLEVGRAGEATAILEVLVRAEPLREQPRALLMRALYESGRHADALRAFQEFRQTLIDEVGIEPSADLADLDRSIATGRLATTAPARTVGGYVLHERIGEGAFAVVHRATQESLGREVAVKVIRAELANRPEFIRRFEAEAQMVARIEHPNLVPLYDYWREPDRAYLVMRWMTGGSLHTRLDDGPWQLDPVIELVDQIAGVLSAAHQQGVVHRDVKPENILFDNEGRAYLADFGIALEEADRARPEAALSEGSPIFASPEQLRRDPVGPEADIHALAIVTYTLLVGRPPFADTPDEPTRLQRHLHEPIPAVRTVRPELPERIDQLLAIAAAKDPSDRYPTAAAFALALRAATDTAPTTSTTTAARSHTNPYKGLRAFDETDTADFFGRERLIDELVRHFDDPDNRLLAIVGPSGSGKSSVVRAGLVPAIRNNRLRGSSNWFTTSMIPGTRPFEALETALLRVAVNPPNALLEQLRDGDRGILRAVRRVLPDDRAQIVLVIDQFEELFTTGVAAATCDHFLDALTVAATEAGSPLRVVLTIRADFYDRPLRHPGFAPLLKQHTVVVTPLAPDELEHAITTPAARAGVTFEPGLVAEIIADVNHEPGALPLLQYALTQAFDQTPTDTIAIDTYRNIGGLTGALAQRAEELWQNSGDDEQHATRRLFGRLVTLGDGTQDTRRRVHLTELGNIPSTRTAIERFGQARLFTFDREPSTRKPTIEIAHEALLSEWPRLGEWLEEDRDDIRRLRHLNRAAHDWNDAGRPRSDLYRGGRLETAEQWAQAHEDDLHDLEQDFLDASIALRDEEAAAEKTRFDDQVRSNQRLRTVLAVTAVVAVVALIAGVMAVQQRSRADEQATEARTQADAAAASSELALQREAEALAAEELATRAAFDAETGRLVATAQSLSTSNPRASLLIARAAYDRETSPATLGALQTALMRAGPLLGYLGFGSDYVGVEWMTDDRVVGAREDGLDLFDPSSGEQLASIQLDIGKPAIKDVGFDRVAGATDAPLLAATLDDTTIVVYEIGDRFVERLRVTTEDPIFAVALSPDGSSLVATDVNNRVTFWNRQGTVLFSEDLDDSSSLLELAAPVLGPDVAISEWLRVLYVRSSLHPSREAVLIGTGSYIHRFGWDGNQLDAPLFSAYEIEPGELTGLPNRGILSDGGEPQVIVNSEGAWFAGDSSSVSDLGPVLVSIRDLGGLQPDILAVFSLTDAGALVLLSNGVVGQVDRTSRSFEPIVDVGLGAAPDAVLGPGPSGRVAIASPTGIALVSLTGGGPIAYSIPRDPASFNTGISPNGRFAVTGGAGTAAPTDVWANNGSSWSRDETVSRGPHQFAGMSVGYGNVPILQVIGPLDPGPRWYSLTGEHPEQVGELSWVDPSYEAGHANGSYLVQGGVFGIQVYSLPSGEPLNRLSAPPGSAGAVISGIRFDPSGERLLVSAANGRSQLWDTSTWEPIDHPLLEAADIAVAYWNEDGSIVATASSVGAASIRDGETFDVIRNMVGAIGTGNTKNAGALLLSADNTLLLTNFDGPGRLWDVATGQQIGFEFPTLERTNSGTNTGHPLQLITATETGALIWNLDTAAWPDIACRAAGSNLTQEEWAQWGPRDELYRPICPDIPG